MVSENNTDEEEVPCILETETIRAINTQKKRQSTWGRQYHKLYTKRIFKRNIQTSNTTIQRNTGYGTNT